MIISHCKYLSRFSRIGRRISNSSAAFSNQSGDSPEDGDSKRETAKQKLDSLLQSIIKDELFTREDITPAAPAKEASNFSKKKVKKEEQEKQNLGSRLAKAAKEVAAKTDEPSKTEAELLHKLLYKDKQLTKSVTKAGGGGPKLSEIICSMKIEEEEQKPKLVPRNRLEYSRADQVRGILASRGRSKSKYSPELTPVITQEIDVFGGKPLNIFDKGKAYTYEDNISTWDCYYSRELKLSVTHPPSNIWEQMIIWTDRGMLWKFPIDNEQGMDEEKETSFTQHVFLESHLEDWCPPRGPIRNFMELVCIGLSRNHWLSAQEKKDHIMWYRDYFSSKSELLKEIGAGEVKLLPTSAPS